MCAFMQHDFMGCRPDSRNPLLLSYDSWIRTISKLLDVALESKDSSEE